MSSTSSAWRMATTAASIDFAQSGVFIRHLRGIGRHFFKVAMEIQAR
jgi:hypothetical protein